MPAHTLTVKKMLKGKSKSQTDKINIAIVFHRDLDHYEKECIYEACSKLKNTYSNIFNIVKKDCGIHLDKYYFFPELRSSGRQLCLMGKPLLEHIMKVYGEDITVLLVDIPVAFVDKETIPIAMFYYDLEKKKASAIISIDILYSSRKEDYIKNILVNLEHEIGEIITSEHCKNRQCPVYFHRNTSEMKLSRTMYCDKCYQKILDNLTVKFKH